MSSDRDDPCFRLDVGTAQVFVDGRLRRHVVTADEDRGYVIAWVQDQFGRVLDAPGIGPVVAQEFGDVMIVLTEEHELSASPMAREMWQRKSRECMQ